MFKKLSLVLLLTAQSIVECKKSTHPELGEYITVRNTWISLGAIGLVSGAISLWSSNAKIRQSCKPVAQVTLGIAGTTLITDTVLKNPWLSLPLGFTALATAEYYCSSQDRKQNQDTETAADLLKQIERNVHKADQFSKKGQRNHITKENAQQFFPNAKKQSYRRPRTVITLM